MKTTTTAILLTLLLLSAALSAADKDQPRKFQWPNGALGAVTLSYDDAIPSHFQQVAPRLEKAGLRATFYIQVDYAPFYQNIESWRKVAEAGHELGNHSLHHPCRKDPPRQMDWLSDSYDLRTYTPTRWLGEMRTANLVLQLIDGRTERTFGNTCCDNSLGPIDHLTSLEELIPQLFVAARGEWINKPIDPASANLPALGHYSGDGKTFVELQKEIEAAVAEGKWIFYMFHGVGKGTHNLYIDTEEHAKLIDYLSANRHRIYTAPAIDIAQHVKQHRAPD